jgi:hypothetical protein
VLPATGGCDAGSLTGQAEAEEEEAEAKGGAADGVVSAQNQPIVNVEGMWTNMCAREVVDWVQRALLLSIVAKSWAVVVFRINCLDFLMG